MASELEKELKKQGMDILTINPVPFTVEVARFLVRQKMSHSALAYPLAALVVVLVLVALSLWLLPKLWRFVRAIVERIGRWAANASAGSAPGNHRDV